MVLFFSDTGGRDRKAKLRVFGDETAAMKQEVALACLPLFFKLQRSRIQALGHIHNALTLCGGEWPPAFRAAPYRMIGEDDFDYFVMNFG